MEKKIKLSPKQSSSLQQIQTQKQQIQAQFETLTQKEGLIVDLVLEANSVEPTTIDSIKLDGDFLVYIEKATSLTKPKPEGKKKGKKKEEGQVKTDENKS